MPGLVARRKYVKSRSGGCLERSGDRKLTVWLIVGTTVVLSRMPKCGEICVTTPKPGSALGFSNKSRRLVTRFRCGCHGLYLDQVTSILLDRKYLWSSVLVLFLALTQQKRNITLCLTALHIAQTGTDLFPFSGDQPLLCSFSLPYQSHYQDSAGMCYTQV